MQINILRDDVRRKFLVIKENEAKDIDKLFKSKKKFREKKRYRC
jgi:hypothetical protein